MIDIEIHGTGGRTMAARAHLLEQTRRSLLDTPYYDQLTAVDTGSAVYTMEGLQSVPFVRIYAPPTILENVIEDIRNRLQELYTTLEGVQVVRINIRDEVKEVLKEAGVINE